MQVGKIPSCIAGVLFFNTSNVYGFYGAHLMTAKARDTGRIVNHRFPIFDLDGTRRATFGTFSASNAVIGTDDGAVHPKPTQELCQWTEETGDMVRKIQGFTLGHLKISDWIPAVAQMGELLGRGRDQTCLDAVSHCFNLCWL